MNKLILLALLLTFFACGEEKKEERTIHYFLQKQPKINQDSLKIENNKRDSIKSSREIKVEEYKRTIISANLKDLNDVNSNFLFRGNLINPLLIGDFMPPVNTDQPGVMSINLSGVNYSNAYFTDSVYKTKEGAIVGKVNGETYIYKWLGRLKNGFHVLECTWNGGGSGYFGSLVFVSFKLGPFNLNGDIYNQLLINCEASYSLSDRSDDKFKLDKENNKVYVSTQPYWEKVPKKFVVEF
jgi:hypothetical protein